MLVTHPVCVLCCVYKAPQDGGYLVLDVVPMMLRAPAELKLSCASG